MIRRILLGAAGVVLVTGLAVALLMTPQRCGMDDDECNPNGDRIAVGVVSSVLAGILGALSSTPAEKAERMEEKHRQEMHRGQRDA